MTWAFKPDVQSGKDVGLKQPLFSSAPSRAD